MVVGDNEPIRRDNKSRAQPVDGRAVATLSLIGEHWAKATLQFLKRKARRQRVSNGLGLLRLARDFNEDDGGGERLNQAPVATGGNSQCSGGDHGDCSGSGQCNGQDDACKVFADRSIHKGASYWYVLDPYCSGHCQRPDRIYNLM